MNEKKIASQKHGSRIALGTRRVVAMTLVSMTVIAGAAHAQGARGGSPLAGVWGVTVTLHNCDTGAPLNPPFLSLVTFAQDGTIQESTGALGFAPNQRSSGHGIWKRIAPRTFSQRVIALVNFDTAAQPPSPGFQAGWQVVDHTVTLVDRNRTTSEGTNQFFNRAGEVYRSGCSTAVGNRFE